MTAVAEIRVKGDRRSFVATNISVADGIVTAAGHWRERWGPDNAYVSWSDPRCFTWPMGEVKSVRWLEHDAAVLDRTRAAVAFP